MGVIRPHKVGLDGAQAVEWVARVADETGFPCYVVNHNVLNRQYAVAGHLKAIDSFEMTGHCILAIQNIVIYDIAGKAGLIGDSGNPFNRLCTI